MHPGHMLRALITKKKKKKKKGQATEDSVAHAQFMLDT